MSTAELEVETIEAASTPSTCENEGCEAEATHYTLEPQSGDSVIKTTLLCEEHAADGGSLIADAMKTPAEPEPSVALEVADPPKPSEPVTSGVEWEMNNIIEVNAQVLAQRGLVEEKADDLKQEKKELERLQDQLNSLISRIAAHRQASEPDPKRFPLFDKPGDTHDADKARVDAMFPKPESIPPGWPSTIEGFREIKARDTRFDALGLKAATLAKLTEAGVATINDLQDKPLDTIKGMTERRQEEVIATLAAFWDEVESVWYRDNPDAGPRPIRDLSEDAGATLGDDFEQHPPDDDGDDEDIEDMGHEYDGMEGGD